ncbi:MAG: phosphotransferase, partial [Lachnospiraceae bacterium]|nr:phosphotransferase [Lachnospiraceae bacterium]
LSHKVFHSTEALFSMWMARFADFHKDILAHTTDDAMDYKDFLKMFAADEITIAKIDALADGNCLIHGDYHLDNVMVCEDDTLVLIDMMNICKGPALYDVARTYFLLSYDAGIQKKYLKLMGCSFVEITPYLEVISAIRDKELGK